LIVSDTLVTKYRGKVGWLGFNGSFSTKRLFSADNKTALLIDITVPGDTRVEEKEKIDKYQDHENWRGK